MSNQPGSLLRRRPFLTFWLARVYAASDFQMLTMAIGWRAYELTGNVLDLSLVGLIELLPRALSMLHTGHVVGRYDRRRVVALHQAGQTLVVVTPVLGMASGEITHNMVFVLASALSITRALGMPAIQALLLNLVPAGLFSRVVTVSTSVMQAAITAAPVLGGLLYAFGASWVYVSTATPRVSTCVLALSLPIHSQPLIQGKAALDPLLAGVRFIRGRSDIFDAIPLDLSAVPLGSATALLLVFAKDILSTGPWGLGLPHSAPAADVLAMSFWLAHSSIKCNVGRIMFLSVGIFGLATVIFDLSKSSQLSLGVLVVPGTTNIVGIVTRGAFMQLKTPDEMRGRVSAVNGLFIGVSDQLGELKSGFTAHWFGMVPAVVPGGIDTLVVTETWMRLFPSLA